MIRCACVNSKDRPNEIPKDKWIKKGEIYTIVFAIVVLPQRELGLQLDEITLDESCAPYEYFLANRFAFLRDDLYKLQEFIRDCARVNMSIKELMNQSNILNHAR